jgi:hypothetical protein
VNANITWIQVLGFKARGSEFRGRGARARVQGPGCVKVRGSAFGVQRSPFSVPGVEAKGSRRRRKVGAKHTAFEVQGSGLRVQGSGLWGWGSGFRLRVLRFADTVITCAAPRPVPRR